MFWHNTSNCLSNKIYILPEFIDILSVYNFILLIIFYTTTSLTYLRVNNQRLLINFELKKVSTVINLLSTVFEWNGISTNTILIKRNRTKLPRNFST